MQAGDMVYYLFTDKHGVENKIPARVIATNADEIIVTIGRYDVHTKEVAVIESGVNRDSLLPRQVPCSYEEELIPA